MFGSWFHCSVMVGHFSSFELQLVRIGNKDPFYCAVVYRPPGINSMLFKEFSDFLSLTLKLSRLVIVGDFNIHIDDDSVLLSRGFLSVADSFHFAQHVSGPTHTKGHTLDLVFTLGLNIDFICTEDIFISDHRCILFNLSFHLSLSPIPHVVSSRILNSSTAVKFSDAFNLVSPYNDIHLLTNLFNNHCLSI